MQFYPECLALFKIQYHMRTHSVKAECAAAVKVGNASLYKSAYRTVKQSFQRIHIRTSYLSVSGKTYGIHTQSPPYRKKAVSVPIGSLFLFKKMGVIPGPEYKKWEKEVLKGNPLRPYAKKPIYLVGGTATALAMVFLNQPEFNFKAIEGLEMNLEDLEKVITKISNVSKELRGSMPGLEKGRSDVIICGLFWLRSLLSRLHAESFRISTAGLRFGLLYPEKQEPNQGI